MQNSHGVLTTLLVLSVAAAMLAGCSPEPVPNQQGGGSKPKTEVAFVTNGVASFWTIAKVGALKAAETLDIECDVRMPDGGVPAQKQIIEDLVTRGIDGIALSPIDPKNQAEQINAACEKTNLITHDSDAPGTKRLVYVGMDNYTAGRYCGQLVKEAMPDGGSLMIFVGRLAQDNARRRRQGVIDELMDRSHDPERYDAPGEVIENDRFTILGTKTDDFDYAKAKANAEDAINRYPDIGCMVGLFAYNPPLCLEALKQANKVGSIKLVAFDEDEVTLGAIKDGSIHGTVVQNPYMYGHKSVEILKALADGDRSVIPASGFIDIPARIIRKDNLDDFWADLKAKLGKE